MRADIRPAAIALALGLTLACGHQAGTAPVPQPSPTVPADPDPLRNAAAAAGKLVGTAVQSSFLNDARYSAVFMRHFDYVTAEYEMKWDPIERTRGVDDFSGGDAIAGFAAAHNMQVKGHALLWHQAVPSWVGGLSPSDLRAAVDRHIRSVVSHYRGRVLAWDVVNEAIDDNGFGLRDSVFRQKLGDGYIADAFRAARESDPQALLFYNDYGGEGTGGKGDAIYELVRNLVAQGVPIDGVGLQMHLRAASPPAESSVAANMRRLAALGLRVNISEMDVRVGDSGGATAANLDRQKTVYHSMVSLCVAEPACHAVTFWGFTDAHTWITSTFGPDAPLLFDAQYAAKPAFYGVFDALMRR
jgi:endo-1,4-beta-xylanase